jgi:ABC-type amino acid transport substrate-binding protein
VAGVQSVNGRLDPHIINNLGEIMRSKKHVFLGMLYVFLCFVIQANAQTLEILTEEDPPYSLTGKDGKPTGFGVEVVNEIQKE